MKIALSWPVLVLGVAAVCLPGEPLLAEHSRDAEGAEKPMKTLFDFDDDGAGARVEWQAVNDGVMGGLSRGGGKISAGSMNFSGELSLENNGGFSSIRTAQWSQDLSSFDALVLRVRGDGRDYQLRLQTDASTNRGKIAYSVPFATEADEWTEIKIPLRDLQASFRGRKLDGPPFDASKVSALGVLIADKKAGPFRLEIDSIRAVADR